MSRQWFSNRDENDSTSFSFRNLLARPSVPTENYGLVVTLDDQELSDRPFHRVGFDCVGFVLQADALYLVSSSIHKQEKTEMPCILFPRAINKMSEAY